MDFEHILDDLYLQLNEVRLHPRETANKFAQLKSAYQGNVFKNQVKTREGPQALENLVQDLSQRSPLMKRLKWSFALHMAADEQASILGQRGIFTTQGTAYHKTLPERVKDYAIIKGRLSQVYQFGGRTPNEILEQLLIDDGLASRKRRNTLMDPIFNYIGIASSYHESHQACTVIILAQDIVSLVAPDANGKYKRRRMETGRENAVKLTEQVVLGTVLGNLIPGIANQPQPQGQPQPPYQIQPQQPPYQPPYQPQPPQPTPSNTLNTPSTLNQPQPYPNPSTEPQFILDSSTPLRATNQTNMGNTGNMGETVTYGNNLGGSNVGGSGVGGSRVGGDTVSYNNNLGGSNAGSNVGGTRIGGETVTYNNPGNNMGGSQIGGTQLGGGSQMGGSQLGGSTVTYNNPPSSITQPPRQPTIQPQPQTVTYNNPSPSLTPSEFQQKQYQFYKQQEPTITVNDTSARPGVPSVHINSTPNVNTSTELNVPAPVAPNPKPEEKSRCSIM